MPRRRAAHRVAARADVGQVIRVFAPRSCHTCSRPAKPSRRGRERVQRHPVPPPSMPGRTPRDPVMDLVRVLCVVVVVIGHMLMIGAAVVPGRGLVIERTLLETSWIGPVTWIAQIMPLFFVVGGFVGIGAWRRIEASGGTAADFIRSRILRLARPSIALFAALAVARARDAPHGRRPRIDPAHRHRHLIAAVVPRGLLVRAGVPPRARDLPRPGAMVDARDAGRRRGGLRRRPVRHRLRGARPPGHDLRLAVRPAAGLLDRRRLVPQAVAGARSRRSAPAPTCCSSDSSGIGYPGNMLDNLYPPTFAIVALAVGQTCLMVLAHPALTRLMARATGAGRRRHRRLPADDDLPLARARARARHRPAAAHAAADASGRFAPHGGGRGPSSSSWWSSCSPLISAVFGRLERPSPDHHPSDWATGLAAACMVIPSFALIALDSTSSSRRRAPSSSPRRCCC